MIVKDSIPTDSGWHPVNIGPIRIVAHDAATEDAVTFWWDTSRDYQQFQLRAFATDESIDPVDSSYVGSDVDPETGEAFHLYSQRINA